MMKNLSVVTAFFLLGLLSGRVASAAKAPLTIAVAPLSTGSAEEYWFIGFALADVMEERLGMVAGVNTLSVKQWNAVLRARDLPPGPLDTDAAVQRVGKLLGARYVISGRYQARWPELSVQLRLVDTSSGKAVFETQKKGHLERMMALEGQLSVDLFKHLGFKLPPAPIRPKSVYAFRDAIMCKEIAVLQSLGPRAEPTLPNGTVWKAKRSCDAALAVDKTDVIALSSLAVLQSIVGDPKAAMLNAKRAVGYSRRAGFADLAFFWVHWRAGRQQVAVEDLRRAVRKRPGYLHARGVLGQALNEMGEYTEAKKVWQAYLKRAPGQPFALTQLGYTLARLGDIDAAVELSDQAIAAAPGDAWLHIEKASRQIDGKRWSDAETTLRQALKLDGKLAVTYLRLGYLFLETNQLAVARPILQKALKEADLESEQRVRGVACFDLAKIEARAGKKDQAIAYLDQAVSEGFNKVAWLEKDPDLDALRSDARYSSILGRARAAAVVKPEHEQP